MLTCILTGLFQLQGIKKDFCRKLAFSNVFHDYLIQNFTFYTLVNVENKLFLDSVEHLPFFLVCCPLFMTLYHILVLWQNKLLDDLVG
jgi:hypothetical protein